MADDNIISLEGRRQVRKDQVERENREKLLREKLERVGLALRKEKAPGRYWISDLRPQQPEHLTPWSNLSLEQAEEATARIADGTRAMNVIHDMERVAAKLSEQLADEPPHARIGALSLLLATSINDSVSESEQERVFWQMVNLIADDLGIAFPAAL
jgi:hypothetical protein